MVSALRSGLDSGLPASAGLSLRLPGFPAGREAGRRKARAAHYRLPARPEPAPRASRCREPTAPTAPFASSFFGPHFLPLATRTVLTAARAWFCHLSPDPLCPVTSGGYSNDRLVRPVEKTPRLKCEEMFFGLMPPAAAVTVPAQPGLRRTSEQACGRFAPSSVGEQSSAAGARGPGPRGCSPQLPVLNVPTVAACACARACAGVHVSACVSVHVRLRT